MKMNKIYCIVLVWRPRERGGDEFRLIDDWSSTSIDNIVDTITDADSWVNIQAKSPEHAKRYFEVAYSKWREEFDDGADPEVLHNTKNVSWKEGHAVIPDDYYCDCKECELNSGLDSPLDG